MAEEEEEAGGGGDDGAPGWIMTFADLMSLLLAFFVLLFSFSELDKAKYKEIGGSLSQAFGVQREVKVRDPLKGIQMIASEFSAGRPEPTVLNEVRQETINTLLRYLKAQSEEEGEEMFRELKEASKDLMSAVSDYVEGEKSAQEQEMQELLQEVRELAREIEEAEEKSAGGAEAGKMLMDYTDRMMEAAEGQTQSAFDGSSELPSELKEAVNDKSLPTTAMLKEVVRRLEEMERSMSAEELDKKKLLLALASAVESRESIERDADRQAASALKVLAKQLTDIDMKTAGQEERASESEEEPSVSESVEEARQRAETASYEKVVAEQIRKAIEKEFKEDVEKGLLKVKTQGLGEEQLVALEVSQGNSFAPGSDKVSKKFRDLLNKLSGFLKALEGKITVAGHTDNKPISTRLYRSNWSLSAARAVSVVHELMDLTGSPPSRFTMRAYGETIPIASNDTREGRAKNRRVEILIRKKGFSGKQFLKKIQQTVDKPFKPVYRDEKTGGTPPPSEPELEAAEEAQEEQSDFKPFQPFKL